MPIDDVPALAYAEEFWEKDKEATVDVLRVSFPCYVNVRLHNRLYGGPEEGGWWYESWERISSHRVATQEALDRAIAHLNRRYNNADRPELSSVLSRGRFELLVSKEPAPLMEPEGRPHYE